MPILEENKVIEMKYAATPFCKMTSEEREISAHSIILKIHVITGWTIPASDRLLDVIVNQFEKKLNEKYRNVNAEEIEYAFRNRGLEIKDWGKELNLTMIDEVMLPYLNHRFELSRAEESLLSKHTLMLEEKRELTTDEWDEWILDMRKYEFKLLPCSAYDYLVKQDKIILSVTQKHEYMNRAIAHLLASFEPGTKEMLDYLHMKKEGVFNAQITGSLITISKRFALQDYFIKNPIDNGEITGTDKTN